MTANEIIEFFSQKEDFTPKEFISFLNSIKIENPVAVNIVEFIATFGDGFFKPDIYDTSEPIRERYSSDSQEKAVSWLSQPGGGGYFKKNKGNKYEGSIENNCFTPIWSEGKLLKPTAPQPEIKTSIFLLLPEKTIFSKPIEFWEDFLKQFVIKSKSKRGVLYRTDEESIPSIDDGKITISEKAKYYFPFDIKFSDHT